MPHIVVKVYPGRTEDQKQALADAMFREVVRILGCREASVSVAVQEVDPGEWAEKVYRRDILAHPEALYRPPGYDPFDKD